MGRRTIWLECSVRGCFGAIAMCCVLNALLRSDTRPVIVLRRQGRECVIEAVAVKKQMKTEGRSEPQTSCGTGMVAGPNGRTHFLAIDVQPRVTVPHS